MKSLGKFSPGEAYIIKGRLESEGIEVIIKQESIGKIAGFTMDGLGEVELLVPDEDYERARRVLTK
ncbi:hypothetical protein DRQ16_00520 [bacterium]|nr:MAG: hypothetical protein DRQ18_02265 [bacterium]RKZ24118.1 MAG: hypothetical protein DRQ16_00520 [bacterium]